MKLHFDTEEGMAHEIQITKTGSPDVMELREVSRSKLAPGEACVAQESIGVNYLDVMQRSGAVPIPIPGGIGLEAAGRVLEVGPDVTNVRVGDRVAYALGPLGAYAGERAYPANRLIALPESLSFDDAAAVTFKGITAQYLLKTTYPVGPGKVLLVYGAAGALCQFMIPWAKHLNADVIGVVSKESSVETARQRGCDNVLVWGECDLPSEVKALTGGKMADVVYDGIGKDTFDASLSCLRVRGTMVSIGASSGAPDPVEVGTLNSRGSLFLTRPSIAAHATDINEYQARAAEVYAAVEAGIIAADIWKTYPLTQVADAHRALESRKAMGPIVVKPD